MVKGYESSGVLRTDFPMQHGGFMANEKGIQRDKVPLGIQRYLYVLLRDCRTSSTSDKNSSSFSQRLIVVW